MIEGVMIEGLKISVVCEEGGRDVRWLLLRD